MVPAVAVVALVVSSSIGAPFARVAVHVTAPDRVDPWNERVMPAPAKVARPAFDHADPWTGAPPTVAAPAPADEIAVDAVDPWSVTL